MRNRKLLQIMHLFYLHIRIFILIILLSEPATYGQKYFFKKYDAKSGLIQNTVRSMYQDKLGRLWIATAEGLNIYDGEEFINCPFKTEPDDNLINCFFELNDSIMLAGTNKKGIFVFLKTKYGEDILIKTFSGKEFLISDNVNNILKDHENNYWICTDSGVTKWNYPNQELINNKTINLNVKHYNQDEGITGKFVRGAVNSNKTDLWFYSDSELIKFDGKNFVYKAGSIQKNINKIFIDGDSVLISMSNKLLLYKDDSIKSLYELPGNYIISDIIKDRKDDFWFATTKGLLKYDGQNFSLIDRTNGLEENFIITLMEDREGNIWIGSINGLYKYTRDSFSLLEDSEKLPHILNLRVDKKGIPWLSTTGGFYFIKDNKLIFSRLNELLKNTGKTDITFLNDNEALVSTFEGIIRIKDYNDGSGIILNSFGKNELAHLSPDYPYTVTYKICEDKESNIWVQNREGKIFLIYKNKTEFYPVLEKFPASGKVFPNDLATSIYCDSKNNIWLGYFNQGLFRIAKDTVKSFTTEHGMKDQYIRSIFEDSKGNIWIGTRYSGVYKYSEEKDSHVKFTQYSVENGLSSNWVMTITEDKLGNLWFGTGKGVTRFDGKNWKVYDDTKGIKAGEMSFSGTGKTGEVFISSLNGIYFYTPDPEIKTILPSVLIKKFQFIDGKNINADKEYSFDDKYLFTSNKTNQTLTSPDFEFKYNQNSFTIEFASTSLRNEEKNLYSYMLEGFDNEWSQLEKRNYVNYVNLPAGSYKFLVKSINNDGLWSISPAEVRFLILPPFWETWWFRVLALVFIISTVALVTTIINRYRLTQVLKMERMRTKIATDLHDDIGTSLSSIAIFSQLAKKRKTGDSVQLNEYLERIEKTSRSLIDTMGDIVWSINPMNDSFEDVILKMEDFAVKLLEAKGIDVSISVAKDIKHIILPLEVRRNLLLIFKEIVTNAAKHSNAERVIINISTENGNSRRKIFIKIKDDGIGFIPDTVYKGNGLKNLRARAEAVKGKLDILSSDKKGSEHIISVPVEN